MSTEDWKARADGLAQYHAAEHQRILNTMLIGVALGRTTIAEVEERLIKRLV